MNTSSFSYRRICCCLLLNWFLSSTWAMSEAISAFDFQYDSIAALASSSSDLIPDLEVESKFLRNVLAETQNFLYSNEIKMPEVDYKVYLQSKVLRRLQSAIDRWTSHEIFLRDVVISGGYQQVQVFDDAIIALANSKALLGYIYWKAMQDSVALHLLEGACSLVWEHHAIIRSPEIYNWLDCFISLRDIYSRMDSSKVREVDHIFQMKFPWLPNIVVNKSFTLMRLRPRTALAELSQYSRSDLVIICTELKRGWIVAEEMRLSMAGLASEFVVASSTEDMQRCLEKAVLIVSRLIEKARVENAAKHLDSNANNVRPFKLSKDFSSDRIRVGVINEILSLSTKKSDDQGKDLATLRVHSLREAILEAISIEANIYQAIMRILAALSANDDNIDILLENILRVDNFVTVGKIDLGVGFHSFPDILQVFEYYARQRREVLRKNSNGTIKTVRRKIDETVYHSNESDMVTSGNNRIVNIVELMAFIIVGLISVLFMYCDVLNRATLRKSKRVDSIPGKRLQYAIVEDIAGFIRMGYRIMFSLFDIKSSYVKVESISEKVVSSRRLLKSSNKSSRTLNGSSRQSKAHRSTLSPKTISNDFSGVLNLKSVASPERMSEISSDEKRVEPSVPSFSTQSPSNDETSIDCLILKNDTSADSIESENLGWLDEGEYFEDRKLGEWISANRTRELCRGKRRRRNEGDPDNVSSVTHSPNLRSSKYSPSFNQSKFGPEVHSTNIAPGKGKPKREAQRTRSEITSRDGLIRVEKADSKSEKMIESSCENALTSSIRQIHDGPTACINSVENIRTSNADDSDLLSLTDSESSNGHDAPSSLRNPDLPMIPSVNYYFAPYGLIMLPGDYGVHPSCMDPGVSLYANHIVDTSYQYPPYPAHFPVHPYPIIYSDNGIALTDMDYSVCYSSPAYMAASETSINDVVSAIKRQIEYYFSAQNLNKDKFLRQQMDKDGYVKLQVIYNFRRIKMMQATPALLLKAVRSSSSLSVVESWAVKAATSEEAIDTLSDDAILQGKVRCAENPLYWILTEGEGEVKDVS